MFATITAGRTVMTVGAYEPRTPIQSIGRSTGAKDQIMAAHAGAIFDNQTDRGGARAIFLGVFAVRAQFQSFDGHARTTADDQRSCGLAKGGARIGVARPSAVVAKSAMQADASWHAIDPKIVGALCKDDRTTAARWIGQSKG